MSRILLKLSGEALSGSNKEVSYDENILMKITEDIKHIKTEGNEIMLIVGGGNVFRGNTLSTSLKIERATADYIGMLATVQNALVLRDYFNSHDLKSVVVSAFDLPQVCEEYIPDNVDRYLKESSIVIFGAGLGTPYFTTDTTAVSRALEMSADEVIFVKNGVDGLYSSDPRIDKKASKIKETTATHVLENDLRILDQTAIALSRDNNLIIRIIGMSDLSRATNKEIGSIITPN